MIHYFDYYKPGLGHSWLLAGLLFGGSLVGGAVNWFWPGAPQSLTYALAMLPPLVWCGSMGRQAAGFGVAPLRLNAPHFGKLPAGVFLVLAAVALIALSLVIEPATAYIPMPDSVKAIFEKAFMNSALWDMVVSTCILAPLLEEWLCRGMMLRGMLLRMRPWKAIFWSAFLFALLHLNPWQSIPAFLIGLFLGWVYWRTHSLWTTIFLHFVNNAFSTVISRIWSDIPVDASWKDILPTGTYWICYAAAAVLLAVLLYILHEKTVSPEVPPRVEA